MEWALVTGGAKRLGAQTCIDLASRGYSVLVHYNTSVDDAKKVVGVCRSFNVHAESIQGDFSSAESTEIFIKRCHEKFPRIKILINNVGNYLIKPVSSTTTQEWHSIFQSNLHVPFALSKAFMPSIIDCQGSVINIGVAGINNMRADTYSSAYTSAKAALLMLTKSLAKEMASKNVRVNMVSPGYLENAIDLSPETILPMGRPATLKEVTQTILFLLDEQNRYITGQNIEVAGAIRL